MNRVVISLTTLPNRYNSNKSNYMYAHSKGAVVKV